MKSLFALLLTLVILPAAAQALEPGCIRFEDFLQTAAEVYPDSSLGVEGWYRDLAVKGQYAYSVVANYSNPAEMLQVIDLEDPLVPVFLGRAGLEVRDHVCLTIWDHYVYVGGPGIKVVDVDDEEAPALVGSIATVDQVQDLVAGPGRLYATSNSQQVVAFSLTDPVHPQPLGSVIPSFPPMLWPSRGIFWRWRATRRWPSIPWPTPLSPPCWGTSHWKARW